MTTKLGRYRTLKASLAKTAAGPAPQLVKGVGQLGHVLASLQGDREIIASPLRDLFDALVDYLAGGKPDLLFKDVPRPADVTTKQKFNTLHYPQGLLAVAYAALVERGKYKPAAAREWSKKELKARGIAACDEDAAGWYRQAKAPNGKPAATLRQVFKDHQGELLELRTTAEAERYAGLCLDTVKGLVGTRPLKLVAPHKRPCRGGHASPQTG
jgi:hypothetical protein